MSDFGEKVRTHQKIAFHHLFSQVCFDCLSFHQNAKQMLGRARHYRDQNYELTEYKLAMFWKVLV